MTRALYQQGPCCYYGYMTTQNASQYTSHPPIHTHSHTASAIYHTCSVTFVQSAQPSGAIYSLESCPRTLWHAGSSHQTTDFMVSGPSSLSPEQHLPKIGNLINAVSAAIKNTCWKQISCLYTHPQLSGERQFGVHPGDMWCHCPVLLSCDQSI